MADQLGTSNIYHAHYENLTSLDDDLSQDTLTQIEERIIQIEQTGVHNQRLEKLLAKFNGLRKRALDSSYKLNVVPAN